MIFYEEFIEEHISSTFENLGYSRNNNFFNDDDLSQVINFEILKNQLKLINDDLDEQYLIAAIDKIKKMQFSSTIEGNIQALKYLKNGISIKIDTISSLTKNVKLIDFDNLNNNCFQYIRQLKIWTNDHHIIPDIVVYLNGLPVSILELKSYEARENLVDAYHQVKNYSNSHSDLMYWNLFSIVSNGVLTKYGLVDEDNNYNNWSQWKITELDGPIIQDIDIDDDFEQSKKNYEKTITGLFKKETFLNILKNYIFYTINNKKYLPNYYQYWASEKAIKNIENAKDGKGGVIWHTQGSGKSVTMLYLSQRIKNYFKNRIYKIILVTDRIELDKQLYKRFAEAEPFLLMEPKNILSREELKKILSDDLDFGIYLTTIQKFTESTQVLSKKDNVIIIADEAHRSHNNVEIDLILDKEKQEVIEKEGYAKYMRDAFPNAIFIGFTGTPLLGHKKTIDIFGDYIHKYTMSQSILDGSTVPIYYQKRKVPVLVDKIKLEEIDEIYNREKEQNVSDYIDRARYDYIRKKIINIKNIIFKNSDIITSLVKDFISHYYESRKNVLYGKALFVAFNREIAFKIYKEIILQKPELEKVTHLIITKTNKDSKELLDALPNTLEEEKLTSEFKRPNSDFKIAIVVDKWLTGFDVPDLDTIYIFKIIKWHNLMQTLARVNRTYSDKFKQKTSGLVIDYIGISKYIEEAFNQYFDSNLNKKFDIDNLKIKLLDKTLELRNTFFPQTNLLNVWINGNPNERFNSVANAVEIITHLDNNQQDIFFNMVSKISKWSKLCRSILDSNDKYEIDFYITARNFIRSLNVEEAIDVSQMLEKLKIKINESIKVGSIEIETIPLQGRKDLQYIFSLLEKKQKLLELENKNLSFIEVKALENEMKEQIKIFSRKSPIKAQSLSRDLEQLIKKYQEDKKIDDFIKNLISFCKIIVDNNEKTKVVGDEPTQAFFDVLSKDEFKVSESYEVLADIARHIMKIVKDEITPQWFTNPSVRQKIQTKIKIYLKNKYNYPPTSANGVSTLIVDEVNNIIKRNKIYFIKEEGL